MMSSSSSFRSLLYIGAGVGVWLGGCVETRGGGDDSGGDGSGFGAVISETLVGSVNALLAEGGSVFLCSGEGGLRVYDITEPSAPSLVQSYYAADPCHALDAAGSRLFVGSDGAFRSFSPNNMLVRGEHSPPYAVQALDAAPGDNAAWLAGLDPAGSLWLEEVAYREDADMGVRLSVSLADGVVPVALAQHPDGLLLLDALGHLHTFDSLLQPRATWQPEGALGPADVPRLALGGPFGTDAYLSLGEAGVVIVDVRDLSAPTTAGVWPGDGRRTGGLLLLEDTLYVGLDGALAILSVSEDPADPQPTAAEDVALGSDPSHIWVASGFGFLGDSSRGLLTLIDLD